MQGHGVCFESKLYLDLSIVLSNICSDVTSNINMVLLLMLFDHMKCELQWFDKCWYHTNYSTMSIHMAHQKCIRCKKIYTHSHSHMHFFISFQLFIFKDFPLQNVNWYTQFSNQHFSFHILTHNAHWNVRSMHHISEIIKIKCRKILNRRNSIASTP